MRASFSPRFLISPVGLIVAPLLLLPPKRAYGCDPNCDWLVFFHLGTLAATGTIVFAPLIGLIADQRENSPYLQVLAFTAVGAGLGWGLEQR